MDYEQFLREANTKPDYNTNAGSYYKDLARKQELIKLLAKRIWEYKELLDDSLDNLSLRLESYINENDSLMSDRLKNWDERIENLDEEVSHIFVEWLNDGTLEQIINNDVLGNKADKVDLDIVTAQLEKNTHKIADNAISPDDFEGTDFEKVQSAIDYAITNKTAIRFARIYDITGTTLLINKPSLTDRWVLQFIGVGGGIRKEDSGYIFSTTNVGLVGDVGTSSMIFEGVNGVGTKVWNANKIIRVTSITDSYKNIDGVVEANETYVQSYSFIRPIVTGGQGWAFEWKKSYDVTIFEPMIEHREHGIRNTFFAGNPDNDNLRITGGVIEGLTGKAMELGSSFGVVIDKIYMEANQGGYIDLSKSSNYHNGLTLLGNTYQQTTEQITNDVPAVTITNMGSGGVFSSGNTSTGVLYDLNLTGTGGRLVSIGDVSYNNKKVVNRAELLFELGRINQSADSVSYGPIKKYNKIVATPSIPPASIGVVEVDFTGTAKLSREDIVSIPHAVGTGNFAFTILNTQIEPSTNKLTIRVRNDSAGEQKITLNVNVLKISDL